MRSRIFDEVVSAPSCVCRNDWAFAMLVLTASVRLMAADSFMPTARPPASSAGLVIFEPLESRLRLFCRFALLALRLFFATVAAAFVLMTIDMLIFLDYHFLRHPCRVVPGEAPGGAIRLYASRKVRRRFGVVAPGVALKLWRLPRR